MVEMMTHSTGADRREFHGVTPFEGVVEMIHSTEAQTHHHAMPPPTDPNRTANPSTAMSTIT
eukprot:2915681-Pyramimonas_sp.AAC.1